ncbi:MAG: adenylate/guanylate cyclase domain-containing protein [Bacteroidota bacterium]
MMMGKQRDLRLLIMMLFMNLYSCVTFLYGQDLLKDPEIVEAQLDDLYGIERLEALNSLSFHYVESNPKKANKYAKQADALADNLFNQVNELILDSVAAKHGLTAYYQYGDMLFAQSKLPLAKERFDKCQQLAERTEQLDFEQKALDRIVMLDSLGADEGFLKKALRPLALGDKISSSSSGLKIKSVLKLAAIHEKKENYVKAIKNYEKAANLMRNQGDAKGVTELQAKIAELNQKAGNFKEALAYYQITEDNFKRLGDSTSAKQAEAGRKSVFNQVKEIVPEKKVARLPVNDEPVFDVENYDFPEDSLQVELDRYKALAEEYEQSEDLPQSIKYYKLYNELNARRLKEQKDSIKLLTQAQEIQLLAQQNELGELQLSQTNSALDRAATFRSWLTMGLVIAGLLFLVFYWLFISKKKAHRELSVTYLNLEETKGQLVQAEKKIKKLLGQQVSDDIAQALLNEDSGNITSKFVCIMFLDIRDFTPFAASRKPEEIIAYQNDVFGFMIEIVSAHHGVINQFMGDGFMATFGAPVSYENDVENAYNAANEIVKEVNRKSQQGEIPPTRVGIGLHAGDVVAGNVGTEVRKQYSVTGNTVITAARIEQLNKTYQTQLLISSSVYERLSVNGALNDFAVETKIKGRKDPITIYKVA